MCIISGFSLSYICHKYQQNNKRKIMFQAYQRRETEMDREREREKRRIEGREGERETERERERT